MMILTDSLINHSNKPIIESLEQNILIIQGEDYSITCEASGSPYPSIKWAKVHDFMPENVHISGNVLTIYGARFENRGVYSCVAENDHGSDLSSTSIDIERKFSAVHDPYMYYIESI